MYTQLPSKRFEKSQPLNAQRIRFESFGGVPCINMATLNMRPPAQTKNTVKSKTPTSPTIGCHIGIVSGVASLNVINSGVKGGTSEVHTAKLLNGSLATGKYINMGNNAGSRDGNVRDWASFASEHVAPKDADIAPNITMAKSI